MARYVLATTLLLAACSDHGISSINDADPNGPAIEVTPSFVEYGAVSLDDEPEIGVFTIESVGKADLSIEDLELVEGSASFTILTDLDAIGMLPPGATKDIEVAFYPAEAHENFGMINVSSNDPINAVVAVELMGTGKVPELLIDPDPLDFGATFVGCPEDNYVDLINVGLDTLVVSDIEHSGDSFFLEQLQSVLPLSIEPGEEFRVGMDFDPWEAIDYDSEIVVHSNEPQGTRIAEQTGTGKHAGDHADLWEIPEDQPTDVMYIVDQSCSMDDNAASLGDNFETYINDLSLFTGDWQIVIANRSDGCNHTGILTPATPDYVNIFQSEINSGDGQLYIDDPERLLTPASAGVEQTAPGECNDGFMREEAILHIVLVSDEPEQSAEGYEHHVNRIIAAKGDPSMTRVSAIAGRLDGVCKTGSADPGTGYWEAVNMTGGVFLDICSDWSENMEALAQASAARDSFELSKDAVEQSIQVFINGAEIDTGAWSFDAESNTVRIVDTQMIPTSGDSIEITYGGLAPCD